MKTYETVTEATNDLMKRGYNLNFNLKHESECIECGMPYLQLKAEEFEIDEVHRFEGNTDPGDEMIVYAISSVDGINKGILVNAYGMYEDSSATNIAKKLVIN